MKLERIPYRIETARLALDSYDPEDADEATQLHAIVARNREHLSKYMSWAASLTSVEATQRWMRESRMKFDAMTDFLYGIRARDDGRLVGGCGLHVRGQPRPFGFEIRYWLSADETRRGFAREATLALTRVALEEAETDRVVIRADVENAPSRRVPEALGFFLEGIARKSVRMNDEPRDIAIYAITRGDPLPGPVPGPGLAGPPRSRMK